MTLTTALYYTKSGNSIQVKGVKPDIVVEEVEDEVQGAESGNKPSITIREGDLPGALDSPGVGREEEKEKVGSKETSTMRRLNKTPLVPEAVVFSPETEDLAEWLKRDRQLSRAFDLLKTFNIFKTQQKSE